MQTKEIFLPWMMLNKSESEEDEHFEQGFAARDN